MAQEAPEVVFRTEAQLLQVEVRVLGTDDEPIRGLTKDDFSLTEDGEEQRLVSADFISQAERLAAVSAEDAEAQLSPPGFLDPAKSQPRVWVSLASQGDITDAKRIADAIERFLREEMREGMAVSIGGLPFTTNRAFLLAVLERMRRGPYGRSRAFCRTGDPCATSLDFRPATSKRATTRRWRFSRIIGSATFLTFTGPSSSRSANKAL